MKKDITNAQVSILLEIDGQVHLAGFDKEHLEVITKMIKMGVELAIPTSKSQEQLNAFLNYNK